MLLSGRIRVAHSHVHDSVRPVQNRIVWPGAHGLRPIKWHLIKNKNVASCRMEYVATHAEAMNEHLAILDGAPI